MDSLPVEPQRGIKKESSCQYFLLAGVCLFVSCLGQAELRILIKTMGQALNLIKINLFQAFTIYEALGQPSEVVEDMGLHVRYTELTKKLLEERDISVSLCFGHDREELGTRG